MTPLMTTITSDELRLAAERIHAANPSSETRVGFDCVLLPTSNGVQDGFFRFYTHNGVSSDMGDSLEEATQKLINKMVGKRKLAVESARKLMSEHGITAEELKG